MKARFSDHPLSAKTLPKIYITKFPHTQICLSKQRPLHIILLWPLQSNKYTLFRVESAEFTFIAPFVAIALNDTAVKNVHMQQNDTRNKDSPMPAIPTIL